MEMKYIREIVNSFCIQVLPSSPEDWEDRDGLVEIMFQCWSREPRHRPSFSSILQQINRLSQISSHPIHEQDLYIFFTLGVGFIYILYSRSRIYIYSILLEQDSYIFYSRSRIFISSLLQKQDLCIFSSLELGFIYILYSRSRICIFSLLQKQDLCIFSTLEVGFVYFLYSRSRIYIYTIL